MNGQNSALLRLKAEVPEVYEDDRRSRMLSEIGYIYTNIDLDSAMRYSERALKLAEKSADPLAQAYAMVSLGRSYMHSGNYDVSLKYMLQCLAAFEKLKDDKGRGLALVNTALVYAYLQNLPYSERYAWMAHDLAVKNKDSALWITALLKHCDNYANSTKTDSLLLAARKAYRLAEITRDSPQLSRAGSYVALWFEQEGQPDSALHYRRAAFQVNQKIGDHRGLAQDFFSLARIYQSRNQMDSAELYAERCRDIAKRYHFLFVERNALGILSEIYEGRNNDKALAYFKEYYRVNDSLYGLRQNQQINAVELNQSRLQQTLEEERKSIRNRLVIWVSGGIMAIGLVSGIFLYRNNRAKHRINQELASTIENLESAQTQLVHAEKMASLGELTAGIAHEIQNPLNFVSNFAEVNAELTQELKLSADKGDLEEIRALAEDIHANEIKIREHGKRADSIVKSMLQHSRSSTGQQEPVDVNALCDEYVKLAYHGMRAKEKNFNANLKTYLSNGLPEVPMIRQDIGRVVLNIVNNAFHAVTERSMTAGNGYQPTVTIKTFMPADSKIVSGKAVRMVSISIADNGTGIPDALRKKIFQPFFTTKPTGQGTGLGLSLSYDIVKAHGGELMLESVAGEGTTFVIQLPIA